MRIELIIKCCIMLLYIPFDNIALITKNMIYFFLFCMEIITKLLKRAVFAKKTFQMEFNSVFLILFVPGADNIFII